MNDEIACGNAHGAWQSLGTRVTQGDGVAPELVLAVPVVGSGRVEITIDTRGAEQLRDRLNVFLAERI